MNANNNIQMYNSTEQIPSSILISPIHEGILQLQQQKLPDVIINEGILKVSGT